MEEKTTNNENLISSAAGSPEELPRDPEGNIIIDQVIIARDDKNRPIIPDEIFDKYYKELPEGTRNESGTFFAYRGGKLRTLQSKSEADKEIQTKGANTLNANLAQRKTNKEVIDIIFRSKAPKEAIERLGLPENATMIEAINSSMFQEALKGNTKAYELLRDTAGEKPTEKIDASLSAMTPEQQKILEDIKAFNSNT